MCNIFGENNTTLEKVTVTENVNIIPSGMFSTCSNLKVINLPEEKNINIYSGAFPSTWLEENNEATDGVSVIIDGYLFGTNLTDYGATYVVPSNVTRITTKAFSNMQGANITIPNTVEYIGGPLADWNLLSVTVGWKQGKKPSGWADDWGKDLLQITYAE